MKKEKKQVGRPKQSETKQPLSLRLSNDVIDIIRSKPNQSAYIEAIVRNSKEKKVFGQVLNTLV